MKWKRNANQMIRTCSRCGDKIPKGRLDAMPGVEYCVRCSDAKPRTLADVDVDGPDGADLAKVAAEPKGEK